MCQLSLTGPVTKRPRHTSGVGALGSDAAGNDVVSKLRAMRGVTHPPVCAAVVGGDGMAGLQPVLQVVLQKLLLYADPNHAYNPLSSYIGGTHYMR